VCLDGVRGYNGVEVVHVLVNFLPGNLIGSRLPNPKNAAVKESRDAFIYQFGRLGLSYGTRIQERSSATPQRIFRSTGRCRSAPSPRGRCRFSSQGQTMRGGWIPTSLDFWPCQHFPTLPEPARRSFVIIGKRRQSTGMDECIQYD
jgi:hypothetical protein